MTPVATRMAIAPQPSGRQPLPSALSALARASPSSVRAYGTEMNTSAIVPPTQTQAARMCRAAKAVSTKRHRNGAPPPALSAASRDGRACCVHCTHQDLTLLGHRIELVADPVAGLDEAVAGGPAVDLVAQPPHEDIHRPVASGLPAAPELLQELVPGDNAPTLKGQRVQEAEL